MFFTDDFYGHRRILADYIGLPGPRPILAHLQHGWNPNEGFGRRYLEGRTKSSRLPTLVWSEHNRHFSEELGMTGVEAVGAPYAYLHRMLTGGVLGADTAPGPTRSTIVYPLHAGHDVQAVRTGEDAFIAAVRDREPDATTVCLYWREYDDDAIRNRYLDAGFRVVTHGAREHPLFLLRQREEMLAHQRVVSNRVSTALWYAGLLRREIEVYGPVFGSGSADETAWWEDAQRRRWPEMMGTPLLPDDAFAVSSTEIGYDQLREPGDLARLLGWTGTRRWVGPVAESAAVARRAIQRRGA
ncbi:MAG: hypothetical protein JWM89_2281 [Acidimicrobiales bacterium]|nr:hypothetical protein [Acidimicrobiales bacterium]